MSNGVQSDSEEASPLGGRHEVHTDAAEDQDKNQKMTHVRCVTQDLCPCVRRIFAADFESGGVSELMVISRLDAVDNVCNQGGGTRPSGRSSMATAVPSAASLDPDGGRQVR
jgi:hypothetical protein